jgi:hypothetical protein
MLHAVLAGLCAGCKSLAQVEQLSNDFGRGARKMLGLWRRVPDTTLRDLLVRISPSAMRGLLWQQVRQAQRQKVLRPDGLPCGVLSIDGKTTAIRSWQAGYAQRQVQAATKSKPASAKGLVRTLTCSLLSSRVPVCIDAAPIPPDTNEDGYFCTAVDRLLSLFRRFDLFRMVVADAGPCSLRNATHLRSKGLHYMFTLNNKQPTLYAEAQRLLADLPQSQALACTSEACRGGVEERRIFITKEMAAFLDWDHLGLVLRVQHIRIEHGRTIEHNRYFVTSRTEGAFTPEQWLLIVRRHWVATENGCHNICDVAFQEDAHPWIDGDDKGMLNVLILRRIALNLLTLFRGVSLRSEDNRLMPWASLLRAFRDALLLATLSLVDGLRDRACV